MTANGYRLRGLDFVSTAGANARLDFDDGLNIIYGASNTGKSFVAKALNFMLGGSRPLPGIDELASYDAVLLRLVTPRGAPVTLYRAIAGGPYLAFDGLHHARPAEAIGRSLRPAHDPNLENLSDFLLVPLGLGRRPLVKNGTYGEKETLTIRRLAPYVVIDETAIISERSPVLSGQHIGDTVERNVLRLLLTGKDDAAVVASVKPQLRQARVSGQIELIDEMIARIDLELGEMPPSREELLDQEARLAATIEALEESLRARQDRIDELVSERRGLMDAADLDGARLAEVEITLARFEELDRAFDSDLQRLAALEEGSSLLSAIASRNCPLCGADPEHQVHRHGPDEIGVTQAAAAAEMAKIRRERRDLAQTTALLGADATGLRRRDERRAVRLSAISLELEEVRPKEAELRREYERLVAARSRAVQIERLQADRDRLAERRALLGIRVPKPKGESKIAVGIDGQTAFEFAQTVQDILDAWGFPGDPRVTFDLKRYDIQINGKDRDANGKGVRAILHAAFKVAVLMHCRERGLPHPGFVVLDTPLLTYREPMKVPRYGPLAEDERRLRTTKLDERFYSFLHNQSALGQFIVLENADPPPSAIEQARVTTFTGEKDDGRFGLFPAI